MLLRSGRNLPLQPHNDLESESTKMNIRVKKFVDELLEIMAPAKQIEQLDAFSRIVMFRKLFTMVYDNFDCIKSEEFKNFGGRGSSDNFLKVVRDKIVYWQDEMSKDFLRRFMNDENFDTIKIREEMKRIMPIVENLTRMFEIV
jgi:hypothetical protein